MPSGTSTWHRLSEVMMILSDDDLKDDDLK